MAIFNTVYGGERHWTPGANTVAYYPLDSTNTVNDLSGNLNNLTKTSTVNFGTYQGVDCAYFNGGYLSGSITNLPLGATSRTISIYVYMTGNQDGITTYGVTNNQTAFSWFYNDGIVATDGLEAHNLISTTNILNGWHHICMIADNGIWYLYIDGVLDKSKSVTTNTSSTNLYIGTLDWYSSFYYKGYMSNYVLENKARTAQEIANYYNKTKSKYGL